MKRFNVGIIGCGMISSNYLRHAAEVFSDWYAVTALGDIDVNKAKEKAEKFSIPKYGDPDSVYGDPEIDLIINLTVPAAHEEVTLRALRAGKHVYSEKPLATSRQGIDNIIRTAEECGRRVGCAPDSFMSAPNQTAKKALEDGWIGDVVGLNAICAMRGNEYWRPDADFFYKKGAGPMMDMAPYYLNLFVSLIGPVTAVSAAARITWDQRTVKVPPRRGEKIDVEVPTFVSSALRFKNGAIGTFVNSFDIWHTRQPFVEIYGEKGTMIVPDPNRYTGEVLVRRFKDTEWRPLPQFVEYENYGRGVGVADMVRAIQTDSPHRASAQLARHVTDVIITMDEAAQSGTVLPVSTSSPSPSGLWTTPETILWK